MSKNMKKHFTALTLIAIFLIAIPLFTAGINIPKSSDNESSAQKDTELTDMLAYEYNENYCKEGLKAVAIILNSNYKAGEKAKTLSKKGFLKKHKDGKKIYSDLKKICKDTKNLCITYKGKAVKPPYYYITNGACKSEQPYLKAAANPWDLLSADYTYDAKPGVSFYSINEMCKSGMSWKESLNRYFKNVKITAVKK